MKKIAQSSIILMSLRSTPSTLVSIDYTSWLSAQLKVKVYVSLCLCRSWNRHHWKSDHRLHKEGHWGAAKLWTHHWGDSRGQAKERERVGRYTEHSANYASLPSILNCHCWSVCYFVLMGQMQQNIFEKEEKERLEAEEQALRKKREAEWVSIKLSV